MTPRYIASVVRLRISSFTADVPIVGVAIKAYLNYEERDGVEAISDVDGMAMLALPEGATAIERLYLEPPRDFWGLVEENLALEPLIERKLLPLHPWSDSVLRFFYSDAPPQAGAGVTIGIVDTGIDRSNPSLRVHGGRNVVYGEDPSHYGARESDHGTHVAGIIACLARASALRSYRVTPALAEIGQAIDYAVEDGCDLINVSIADPDEHENLPFFVDDARERGCLVIAAAGNDSRPGQRIEVRHPARGGACIGVAASGRVGTYPAGSLHAEEEGPPRGSDARDYSWTSSCVGDGVDLVAPGVQIISTVTGGFAAASGTSQACAATTGVAARLLSENPGILAMPRDRARSDAIAKLLLDSARPLGFGGAFEGRGMPRIGKAR